MELELYKHNKVIYEQVKAMFEKYQKCCVIMATGTIKKARKK